MQSNIMCDRRSGEVQERDKLCKAVRRYSQLARSVTELRIRRPVLKSGTLFVRWCLCPFTDQWNCGVEVADLDVVRLMDPALH